MQWALLSLLVRQVGTMQQFINDTCSMKVITELLFLVACNCSIQSIAGT